MTRADARTITVVHLMRHGEVHNPERRPLRPAARLPPLRARPADGRPGRRAPRRPRHHPRRAPPRWSGRRRRRRRSPRRTGSTSATDDAADRGGERLRGQDLRRRRRRAAQAGATGSTCATRSGRPGASRTSSMVERMLARARRGAGRRPRARGGAASATSCRSGSSRRFVERRRLWHDPRKRQCTLASLTTFTYDGDELVSVGYSEPARDLLPAPVGAGKKFVAGA